MHLDAHVHRFKDGPAWQRALYRLSSGLTCFLQDVSLGVYDDIDWEKNSAI